MSSSDSRSRLDQIDDTLRELKASMDQIHAQVAASPLSFPPSRSLPVAVLGTVERMRARALAVLAEKPDDADEKDKLYLVELIDFLTPHQRLPALDLNRGVSPGSEADHG